MPDFRLEDYGATFGWLLMPLTALGRRVLAAKLGKPYKAHGNAYMIPRHSIAPIVVALHDLGLVRE